MSTRGCLGFRINGSDKVTYNHSDSYPDGLGINVLIFVRDVKNDELKAIAERIQLVDSSSIPTDEQIKMCIDAGLCNTDVSSKSEKDWYCLLRNAQGDLNIYRQSDNKPAFTIMSDSHDFLEDSLFCEWAYIINMDNETLEVYHGWNKNQSAPGRYASKTLDDDKVYYGVQLLEEIPLSEARLMEDEYFVNLCEGVETDEVEDDENDD